MIKAIVFDCFGVLTQDGWLAFLEAYATNENSAELHDLNVQEDRGYITYPDFLAATSKLSGAPDSVIDRMVTTELHPNSSVFALIAQLARGYKLGVISNVGRSLDHYLDSELLQVFEEITLSCDVHTMKPDSEIYQYHLNKLNVSPEEAIFIDDRQVNVDGARAVGMRGVFFKNADQLRTELVELGVEIN